MKICPACTNNEFGGVIENGKCNSCGYIYNRKVDNPIEQWCIDIIEGTGGLDDFEYYEMATPNARRDIAIAMWVIRCLANPHNPKTKGVLEAIEEKRKEPKRED